jgi:hypothetical protein
MNRFAVECIPQTEGHDVVKPILGGNYVQDVRMRRQEVNG